MSISITLVRHGESTDNVKALWAGHRDAPLSNHGNNQAARLGKAFANVPLTAIYCSDLSRAHSTANAILKSQSQPTPPPICVTPVLREQFFGDAEGQNWSSGAFSGQHYRTGRDFKFPQGESLNEVARRAEVFVTDVIGPWTKHARRLQPGEAASSTNPLPPPTNPSSNETTPLPFFHPSSQTQSIHLAVVAHGIFLSELLFALARAEIPNIPYVRHSGFQNTGWSRLHVTSLEKEDEQIVEEEEWKVPVPRSKVTSSVDESGSGGETMPFLKTDVLSLNNFQHLDGLKRQKGGIGSSAFDPNQAKLETFFGGGGSGTYGK